MPLSQHKLAALTVAELRARCKQLGITGISKLTKPDLITRLLAAQPSDSPERPLSSAAPAPRQAAVGLGSPPEGATDPAASISAGKASAAKQRKAPTTARSKKSKKAKVEAKAADGGARSTIASPATESPQTADPASEVGSDHASQPTRETGAQSPNERTGASPVDAADPPPADVSRLSRTASSSIKTLAPDVKTRTRTAAAPVGSQVSSTGLTAVTPKRTANKRHPISLPNKPIAGAAHARFKPLATVTGKPLPPVAKLPSWLHPLTNLPSLAVTNPSASRVAYIRSHFLNRLYTNIHSSRVVPITSPYPSNLSNLSGPALPFPSPSIADLAFQTFHPTIYALPTPAFQAAVRFVVSRLHTMLALGAGEDWGVQAGSHGLLGPDLTKWPTVVECSKVVDGIYCIVTQQEPHGDQQFLVEKKSKASKAKISEASEMSEPTADTGRERFLVLGATGEAVARSRRSASAETEPQTNYEIAGCAVRPDWHTYITARLAPGHLDDLSTATDPLHAHVRTKDDTWCPGGIAKLWAARASPDAMDAARRVVLSSCVLNSFTGEKLGAVQMDAEWLGRPSEYSRLPASSIELYLPESHQITSLALGPPLHPALAAVTRMDGTAQLVLAETGQAVGGDEVAPQWCGILGCDERGHEDDARAAAFWAGWEGRVVGEAE